MRHSVDQRLHYISGPTVYQAMRPAAAASNWWEIAGETCVAAYQPKGAASLAASYTNLANPGTNDAAPGNAPTFNAATGWTFAGLSNQYLTTGVTPVSTSTIIIRVSGSTVASNIAMGSSGTNARLWVGPAWTPTTHAGGYGNALSTAGVGSFPACVMANAAGQLYIDGSASVTISGSWGTPAAITIGAHQGASNWYTGNVLAAAIYSTTLDATQVATLSAAMAAL